MNHLILVSLQKRHPTLTPASGRAALAVCHKTRAANAAPTIPGWITIPTFRWFTARQSGSA
ncbi:hypothetical protein [uncultured Paracoccus sp.]|uniref:hypothetical protein n=1 Tax=uncultured Paracoccus sp. TaxID=189685 RepID=UPI00262AA198|nr:hypothetical protein [uncultured Paracoccus sp.]